VVNRNRSRQPNRDRDIEDGDRLQKALAAAGIGSRRQCEELILEGRVEIDGQVAQELGVRVDVTRQEIRVDGVSLPMPKRVHFLVNKPTGVVCTNHDPSGRTRVIDLVGSNERLFTVGRLDRFSEGLILVTNDGELANLLTHPRYGVEKIYHVRVAGHPTTAVIGKLREGVRLAEVMARIKSVRIKKRYRDSCDLEIVLDEGRNREIRRVLARVGHKVMQLRRISMGPLRLGELPAGAHRRLTQREVSQLRQAAQAKRTADPPQLNAKPTARPTGQRRSPARASSGRESGKAPNSVRAPRASQRPSKKTKKRRP